MSRISRVRRGEGDKRLGIDTRAPAACQGRSCDARWEEASSTAFSSSRAHAARELSDSASTVRESQGSLFQRMENHKLQRQRQGPGTRH